jgi:flagellin-like protein
VLPIGEWPLYTVLILVLVVFILVFVTSEL